MASSHHHQEPAGQTGLRLGLSLVLTLGLVIGEALAGFIADSLALLTDAIHNLTDVAALALTWYAYRQARQPAHAGKTFGYHRVGILAALINSSTLVLIAAGIFYEAYQRLQSPPQVVADLMIVAGAAAFVINLVTAGLIGHGHQHDLNLRSAFLHLMGDVFSTLGAVAAGIGIHYTGMSMLDPAASILIALLILWNAWLILRETVDILLEGTPRDIEMSTMVRDILQIEGVRGVHHLHVWSLSQQLRVLSAHVVIDDMLISDAGRIRTLINVIIARHYGIGHSTLQLECQSCPSDQLYCNLAHHGRDHDHSGHDHSPRRN